MNFQVIVIQYLESMWANFHTHSNYCDGKGELSDFVKRAVDLRMKSIGFSSHAPLPFPCRWSMKESDLLQYIEEIKSIKEANPLFEVYAGLESDYIPGKILPQVYKSQMDYVIGSLHFVDQLPDGTPWEIDGPYISFREGLQEIFHNKIKDAISRYFELTREMITTSPPDVLGHLDKIKIQNINNALFSEDESWYQAEIKKIVKAIENSGVIVEVNTRGVYQRKSSTTYPSPWILQLLHQKRIPITLSSDAHVPDDLINQFWQSADMLLDIGFKGLSVLHEGKWKQFNFNRNGIIFP